MKYCTQKGVIVVNVGENIMVCVTQQKTCERLIKSGAVIKNKINGELFVIHVVKDGVNFLGNQREGEALEYLFSKSKEVGADLTVLRSRDISEALINFAKDRKIKHVVLGEPPKDYKDEGIISELRDKLSGSKFYIIPVNELD